MAMKVTCAAGRGAAHRRVPCTYNFVPNCV